MKSLLSPLLSSPTSNLWGYPQRAAALALTLLWIAMAGASSGCADPQLHCESDDDCFTDVGYRCDLGKTNFCLRACSAPSDPSCLNSQACDLSDPDRGVCRDKSLVSGGGGAGTGGSGTGGAGGGGTGGGAGGGGTGGS